MAVKLRLTRMGKKKQPFYRMVAIDSKSPRDGKYIESIGYYNPKTNPRTIKVDEERALYWLGVGAQPSDTVKSILRNEGLILKNELIRRGLPEEKIEAELTEWRKMKEASMKTKETTKSKTKKTEEKQESTAEAEGAASEEKKAESEVKAEKEEKAETEEKKAESEDTPKAESEPEEKGEEKAEEKSDDEDAETDKK